jgi:hypothetical protein
MLRGLIDIYWVCTFVCVDVHVCRFVYPFAKPSSMLKGFDCIEILCRGSGFCSALPQQGETEGELILKRLEAQYIHLQTQTHRCKKDLSVWKIKMDNRREYLMNRMQNKRSRLTSSEQH